MSSFRTVVFIESDTFERLSPRPNRLWAISRLGIPVWKRATKHCDFERFCLLLLYEFLLEPSTRVLGFCTTSGYMQHRNF